MPAKEETRKRVVTTLYWKELRRMLQDCGGIVKDNGLDIKRIAAAAGTHHSTTKNLFDGTTLFPHYRTVWCNIAAMGWKVSPVERPERSKSHVEAEIQRVTSIHKKKTTKKKKSRGGKRSKKKKGKR